MFFRRIWANMTGRAPYGELAAADWRQAMRYLSLLCLLLYIVGAGAFLLQIRAQSQQMLGRLLWEAPDFYIENGVLHYQGPQPYTVKQPGAAFFVDTTGQLAPEEVMEPYATAVFVSSDTVYAKNQLQTAAIPMEDVAAVASTKAEFVQVAQSMLRLLPVFQLLIFPFFVLEMMLAAAVLALVGRMMQGGTGPGQGNRAAERRLSFASLWVLSVHALTAPMVLRLVKDLAMPKIPFFFLIFWGLAIYYLNRAVKTAGPGGAEA